ncbi:TatD family hydrolase [Conexibacter sp. DBS9H8]|uniref:TatD family hydrolase n=1 Tax=Conexibacter sp. DBS9H8 TaxID=2937801 RepID=UPI00200F16C7|nr:TatD family hydrolase [Conexibacter sp. DBS9H8]
MIDSHTHLHLCGPDQAATVAEATAAGVGKLLTVGTNLESSRDALGAVDRFPGVVHAAVGIHPNEAGGVDDGALAELAELAADPRCAAVGETGLDHYRQGAPAADQERVFLAHIAIARAVAKPLVIHTRAAEAETLAILDTHAAGLKVILHCFSMPDRVGECLAHPDWWISFAGNVTYPANAALRDAALAVPAERLLVETDAPYLSPVPHRGTPNTPARVLDTAAAIAEHRRVPITALTAGVEAAAAAVLGW